MDKTEIFKDLKVIELASVLAGPAVGMFFAELGAKVIKIENATTGGDMTRKWKLPTEDKDNPISAYYASVNWNKEVLMLNLKTQEDQAKVHKLIKGADVVIANYKPGQAEKLNMDQLTLRLLNPKLIYAHLSGFGQDSSRTAFDVVVQAEAGFMSMNGQPNDPPTKMPVALMDVLAAHQLKEGILSALYQREKTGKGSFITASLFDSAVASLANQASNWLMAKHNPSRIGSLHPNIAPYGEIITTSDDQQIVLAIGTENQFQKLCKVLGIPVLANDIRFSNNSNRVINRKVLLSELQKIVKTIDSKELIGLFLTNDIPAGSINDMQSLFQNPKAQNLILTESKTKRVSTAIFSIND